MLDGLVDQMVEEVTGLAEEGQPAALLVHSGKWASGPAHEWTALPAVFQRVAAARARYELRLEGVQAPILETE